MFIARNVDLTAQERNLLLLVWCLFLSFASLCNGSSNSDISRDLAMGDNPNNALDERSPASLRDEYNYLRNVMSRRHNLRLAQNMLQAMDDRLARVQKRTRICLPSTDCDFIDWPNEADAKDILRPGADTNPGRRKRLAPAFACDPKDPACFLYAAAAVAKDQKKRP